MKKLLITLLTSLCAVSAFSQESNLCGRPEQAVKLMREYGETVVFRGSRFIKEEGDRRVFTAVLISLNSSTGTWSIFEAQENGVVCLIATGIGGKTPRPGLTI